MSPSTANEFPVQKSGLDLNTFEDVTLKKMVKFTPVSDVNEAVARLGNDPAKLIEVINNGLRSVEAQKAREDNSGWFETDEKGALAKPFEGQLADGSKVNPLVLNLAKTIFGYDSDKPIEERRAAKESAINLIRSNPVMLDGLKKTAAAVAGE